jgi:hypothetical protein
MNLKLSLFKDKYIVCKLNKNDRIPAWAYRGDFFSITKTFDELSLVCLEKNIESEELDEDILCERDWRIFKVEGRLDFSLIGIMANLSGIMKEAEVSIFALSTYDTDYIMVKDEKILAALMALRNSGHQVTE